MNSDAPLHLANAAGLSLELDRNGGVRLVRFGEDVVSLFPGNGIEPGPANLWLRLHRGTGREAAPLLGPRSPLRLRSPGDGTAGFSSEGEWQGLGIAVRLDLAEQDATWCWQVRLENRSAEERTFDLLHVQDVALASLGAVRLNEHYVSQYVDLTPLEHPRCGWMVAARQNLAQGGRHPWAVVGSLRRGSSFATDGLQVFGLAQRMGELPTGVRDGLPGERLQHEHAMAAVQDEAVTLAPGATWSGGFFVALEADHPAATSAEDLAAADAALSWADSSSLEPPSVRPEPLEGRATSERATLFSEAPFLECLDLDAPELRRLFPSPWRHEERDPAGRLLSFFRGEDGHVVLRAKEAGTQRPHGHILRTGRSRTPEESSLTSTAWMSGVFHSMVTQGHVSKNRFLSTVHSWLGLFRSHGLRVFVRLDGGWRLLGVPSAFEMTPGSCRWLYRHARGAIEVVSAVDEGAHALSLRGRVLDGPALAWLATLHVAVAGDDGNLPLPIPWRIDGTEIVVGLPEGSKLHERFPEGSFAVAPHAGTALARVGGDERLFLDGRGHGLPWLALEGEECSAFGLDLVGRLVPGVHATSSPIPLPRLSPEHDGAAAEEVRRLAEALPWFLHDAQVHYLSPRGLEQYSGGGWGTRDVCQGPLEMLLALDCPEAARDVLLRVFAAQDEGGDWPQWFQFLERERELRAPDSHGDVALWPVLAAGEVVLGTGDASLLDARVPFFSGSGRAEPAPVLEHLDRALDLVRRRCVAGTALAAYGHGDWNDSLQPADPAMRDRLCSTWTVILHHQALTTLARAMRFAGHAQRAAELESEAGRVRRDLRQVALVDGVLAGYAVFSGDDAPEPLFHPRDRRTSLRYSLLPMMHAILEGLLTPEEAAHHRALVREHLWAPDGARLFDRPLPYHGGIERLFQRAETSAFFGREIGLLYTHAHLRYAQMQAHVGDARGLLRSLALAHPVQLRERLPQASLRQANCYFSSSDAAFPDRYRAEREYARVAAGTVALDGGWRVYSSGPGIALSLVVTALLGIRRDGEMLVIDPVIAPELSGLRAEVPVLGRRLQVEYQVDRLGYSPRAVLLDGHPVPFDRLDNPYRAGGVAIARREWMARLRGAAPGVLRVELG
jgi:cellobiose phosphorylase